MAQSAVDKIPPGPKLDALTAEKVFGWKSVHKHHDRRFAIRRDLPQLRRSELQLRRSCVPYKEPRAAIKCRVADGDLLGSELKLVCF